MSIYVSGSTRPYLHQPNHTNLDPSKPKPTQIESVLLTHCMHTLMITSTHSFPLIFMVKPLSETTKTIKVFPPGLMTQTPAQILEYAKSHYFHFLLETMRFKYTPVQILVPEIPFGGIFELFCEIGWDLCEPTI